MKIVTYNPNLDCFAQRNIASWARNNRVQIVYELHRNAFSNPSANGYETLIDYRQRSIAVTNLHRRIIERTGYRDRGIKVTNGGGGRALYNSRQMFEVAKIPYCLLELGFMGNANDNSIFDRTIKTIEEVIVQLSRDSGLTCIGIVYGHGARDPGAVALGRREADDVRKIKPTVNSTSINTPQTPQNHPSESGSNSNDLMFYVQVGAYSNKRNAVSQFNKITAKGFNAIIKKQNNLYRVQTGAFSIKENADSLAERVRQAGFDTYVTTVGGEVVPNSATSSPTPTMSVGSRVKVNSEASSYATGQTIPNSVKGNVYTVMQISGDRVLLREIYSWVFRRDITLV